ncbi:MAG: methyltransferase domain-containing protein [Myxococcota bacterium]
MPSHATPARPAAPAEKTALPLHLLRCPATGEPLVWEDGALVAERSGHRYPVHAGTIPLFAEVPETRDASRQQAHYEKVASQYIESLGYAHTIAYNDYLDDVFLEALGPGRLGTTAELCCGHGEAFALVGDRVDEGLGVDISVSMLEAAAVRAPGRLHWLQGDATRLPLPDASLDHVLMFGGIHHVSDRAGLFAEIARVLKPGGRFLWREPVSDFWLWRALRAVVYRLSPALDHETERPLLKQETLPPLRDAGLEPETWRTCGFFAFTVLMNSDVLVVNRWLRFLPGIRAITRALARFDDACLRLPGLADAGLQVVGAARKPGEATQG